MRFRLLQLQLNKSINIFFIIQAIGIVWMAFLHASGQMYPASVLLTANYLLYIFKYGKLSYFFETGINRIFFFLTIVSIISFTNYFYYDRYTGSLFYNCSLFQLFCYSLLWVNLYMFFYVYGKKNNKYNLIYIFAIFFFIAGIINNIRAYQHFRVVNSDLIQHHYYYFTLQCLPLLLLYIQSWKKYILILIVTLCSVYAFKRAGIIVCSSILLANIIIDGHFKIKRLLIYILLAGGVFLCTYHLMEGNDNLERVIQRMENIQDDNGSGRGDNLKNLYTEISNSSLENQIFGYGFMSMLAKHKHMVDAEWGSMLYYYGIIGIILYILFHILMVKRIIMIAKSPNKVIHKLLPSYTTCYIIFLIYSIAGEVFTYHYLLAMIFVYLGISESILVKNN